MVVILRRECLEFGQEEVEVHQTYRLQILQLSGFCQMIGQVVQLPDVKCVTKFDWLSNNMPDSF